MINFTEHDKRWLEIVFYFLIRKIFSINQNINDIYNFINGYRWTNMFNCDILIDAIANQKLLLDQHFIPSKQEFLVAIAHDQCRLRIDRKSIRELIKDTEYTYWKKDTFHAAMREEINQTLIYPRLTNKHIHKTIYSFLLAIRYIADIVKTIKF